MQSTPQNPLLGMESRTTLLQRLGTSLLSNPDFNVGSSCRPGNLVGELYYLFLQSSD